ncbi:CoA-binding protein [Cupriavidus basilensis]
MPDLDSLLKPRSVAVIGASTQPDKVGGMPIRLLRELGYAGRIYPVHPSAGEIQGLPAYPSMGAIGEPVDLAIVAVPAVATESVMAQLAQNGTRAAIFFTSGFAEVGEEGQAMQLALADSARRHRVALLGPNCLGAMNLRARLFATFSPIPLTGAPPVGDVGLVSQSGAFGAYAFALAREAGLGLSHWVTTGNEAGLQVADVIEWMAQDDDTRVILAYMEGCRDGQRLRQALAAARAAGKPVVITKVGTTEAGARSAQSHTASLAGEDAVYQAVFDEYGVHRAHTLEDFFRLGYTLSRGRRPARWSSPGGLAADAVTPVAILTVSGGVGIMMADRAEGARHADATHAGGGRAGAAQEHSLCQHRQSDRCHGPGGGPARRVARCAGRCGYLRRVRLRGGFPGRWGQRSAPVGRTPAHHRRAARGQARRAAAAVRRS